MVDTMTNYREIALEAYGGREPGRMKASITAAIGVKRCSRCREWMPVENFGVDNSRTDGLHHTCKGCLKSYFEEWHSRPENVGKRADYTRSSRYSTPEARERTARNRHRDRCRNFGITPEIYAAMLESQGGGCAICGRTKEDSGRRLAIDHDHRCCPGDRSCGRCVRGILCAVCNTSVGYFENEERRVKCQAYVDQRRG